MTRTISKKQKIDSYATSVEYINSKYQKLFPKILKSDRERMKNFDGDQKSIYINNLVSCYKDKYGEIKQFRLETDDEFVNQIFEETVALEIDELINDDVVFDWVCKVLEDEIDIYKSIMVLNDKLIEYKSKNDNKKVELIKKLLS